MMDEYDWADQERLRQMDLEEIDRQERMQVRRRRRAQLSDLLDQEGDTGQLCEKSYVCDGYQRARFIG